MRHGADARLALERDADGGGFCGADPDGEHAGAGAVLADRAQHHHRGGWRDAHYEGFYGNWNHGASLCLRACALFAVWDRIAQLLAGRAAWAVLADAGLGAGLRGLTQGGGPGWQAVGYG